MNPLTIDQLKALKVGDWVWVKEPIDYNSGFYIKIHGIDNDCLFDTEAIVYKLADYGKTWIAYKNKEQAEAKGGLKAFAEKVKPIIGELVEMLLDDNVFRCKIEDCDKTDDIQCGASICIEENKAYWNNRIDELLKEFIGE